MTLWMCPCLRPHMVRLSDRIQGERYRGYCDETRQTIDLLRLGPEDQRPREYEPKRSAYTTKR